MTYVVTIQVVTPKLYTTSYVSSLTLQVTSPGQKLSALAPLLWFHRYPFHIRTTPITKKH